MSNIHYRFNTNLVALAEEIHDRSWTEADGKPIDRAFVQRYVSHLECVAPAEFLTYCLCSFDKSYCNVFLLCIPEIWKRLTLNDWMSIAIGLSPRPIVDRFDPTGRYSDVVFFVEWLNLDYLGFAFSNEQIPIEDKVRLAKYCIANADSLTLSHDDLNDLDSSMLCEHQNLTEYRRNLLSQCSTLSPSYHDELELRRYALGKIDSISDK